MKYQIRLQGNLDSDWSAWFNGMTVTPDDTGETVLTGHLPDQAALHGVLKKIRDLGLPLLAIHQIDTEDSN